MSKQSSQPVSELEKAIGIACQKTRMIPSGVRQKEYARLKWLYVAEAVKAIDQWVEEVIGELEPHFFQHGSPERYKNQLRAEQRQRWQSIKEGK